MTLHKSSPSGGETSGPQYYQIINDNSKGLEAQKNGMCLATPDKLKPKNQLVLRPCDVGIDRTYWQLDKNGLLKAKGTNDTFADGVCAVDANFNNDGTHNMTVSDCKYASGIAGGKWKYDKNTQRLSTDGNVCVGFNPGTGLGVDTCGKENPYMPMKFIMKAVL